MHPVTAEWKHLASGSSRAEGRLILAPRESGDLILFCPGFPGGGATLFEQRYAEILQKEEYSLFTLRHNGTRLDTDVADFMLNRRQFPKAVPFHDGDYIGGASSSIAEWVTEPQTVLETLGAEYTNITVIGHSFGAVAALYSLINLNNASHRILERINRCILLAPAVGLLREYDDDVMDTLWHPEFIASEIVTERVALNAPESILQDLRNAYVSLRDGAKQLPTGMKKIFVHVERDEYVRYQDVEEFANYIDPDSIFMVDKFERRDPRHGLDAHDMPNFPQQSLLDLIEGAEDIMPRRNDIDGFNE